MSILRLVENYQRNTNRNFKNKNMKETYLFIKKNCELPVALLLYTYKDFDGVIHPFNSIPIDLHDEYEEENIKKMEEIKNKYGEFFMFFNNSEEGIKFWKENPIILITPKN